MLLELITMLIDYILRPLDELAFRIVKRFI